METPLKLFMVMLGCKPKGRVTEQHDIFFGIGTSLNDLIPQMNSFWPEANDKLHIDAWREVCFIDGNKIEVVLKENAIPNSQNLFFINLGGYKHNEFEEYHYKLLAVAESMAIASIRSKDTAFYKHFGFKGAVSHIDDKYGIDVDDIYRVVDILPVDLKDQYALQISKAEIMQPDELHIGYVRLEKL